MLLQSFFAGLAASGALTSALRLITKASFDQSKNGLRKGVSTSFISISVGKKIKTFEFENNFVFMG